MIKRLRTKRKSQKKKRNVHGEQKDNSQEYDDIVVYRISQQKSTLSSKIAAMNFQKIHTFPLEWLIASIIDCYLLMLVLQDVKRCPPKKRMNYVPTSFFTQLESDDTQTMHYSDKMHKFFVDQKMEDYDGIIFGGTDDGIHFFMVVLFLEKKEVFIFDPSNVNKTINVVAKFLYLLFQHSTWLDSGNKNFRPGKKYTFSEEEKKKWTLCHVKAGGQFMPMEGDKHNCGLDLIMLCEAFIRGIVPMHDSEVLESIDQNGHLISCLATGIPLLGEYSLYPIVKSGLIACTTIVVLNK